jgi:hypothetical protein
MYLDSIFSTGGSGSTALDTLQRPAARRVWPYEQSPARIVAKLLWYRLLLHNHSAYLIVVFDQSCLGTLAPETSLQGVEDVLQAIVNVMNVVPLPLPQVEENHNLEFVVRAILNSGLLARF